LTLKKIDEGLDFLIDTNPQQALASVLDYIELMKEEDFHDYTTYCRAYYDAFQICAIYNDELNAKKFATLAAKACELSQGTNTDYYDELCEISDDPKKYNGFGSGETVVF